MTCAGETKNGVKLHVRAGDSIAPLTVFDFLNYSMPYTFFQSFCGRSVIFVITENFPISPILIFVDFEYIQVIGFVHYHFFGVHLIWRRKVSFPLGDSNGTGIQV